jgi:hypothetical protein
MLFQKKEKEKTTKKKTKRERESETPASLHIGGMIAFSISHL